MCGKENNKVAKVVVIGAGSAIFAKNLLGDLILLKDVPLEEIALVDINEEKLRIMEQVICRMVKQEGREIRVVSSTERRDVLPGADYVINAIGVGGPEIYQRDLEIADKYGVRQVVGDIIGPGGIFRMLRAYPAMRATLEDMKELCPDAYYFNYTNPMAGLCLALNQVSDIKIFGFCHSVQGTAEQIADYLGVDYDRLTYWAAGINHMAWYLQLKVDGKDAYPQFKAAVDTMEKMHEVSEREHGYHWINDDPKMKYHFSDAVRMIIMQNFGYFNSESPYHMSEYTPYFRKNEEEIRKYRVEDRWWLAHELANDDYYDELVKMIESGEDIPFEITHEYAPKVIRGIETGIPFRANLNVMNTGLITNMPNDCCVEVPCYCDSEGIHPCYVGPLPEGPLGLNMSNISVQKLQAKAANEKKLEWIYQSIQLDPFTAAQCTLEQIRAMTKELIENNRDYLTDFT